jgi:hypothetical protein
MRNEVNDEAAMTNDEINPNCLDDEGSMCPLGHSEFVISPACLARDIRLRDPGCASARRSL